MKHFGNFVALLILAVNALFTGLLLFTAYSPHIQPVTHPVQSCLGLTFPVFLMINAGFLIFWLVIQRYRSALLPLIGMLLCYSQIRTYLPINFHTDHLPETSIKLLSYNIMGFDGAAKQDGKNPILTYLKESGADILCLQEYSTVQSSKHLSQKDVERELKAYPYHRINTVGSGKGHTNKIACYSKFPILSLILGSSPHLPVSVCGTGTFIQFLQAFLASVLLGNSLLIFSLYLSIRVFPLPRFPSTTVSLAFFKYIGGAGISTCCPSDTPFGLLRQDIHG